MRSEAVLSNRTCNQGCVYCNRRRDKESVEEVRHSAVLARIQTAISQGAGEIVFTGGEPLMRSDLTALIAFAKRQGARQVTLETNATLVGKGRAAELLRAGLTKVRVNLPGWGETADAITRDPGGFDRTLAGMKALAEASVPIEIDWPAILPTRSGAAQLPRLLREHLPGSPPVAGIVVRVPVESPDSSVLASYAEVAGPIASLASGAQELGIPVRFSPECAPPPCVVPELASSAHLFCLTRGNTQREGYQHHEACHECAVADRCSGLASAYVQRFGIPDIRPVRGERLRRRLSLAMPVDEQVRREFVQPSLQRTPGKADLPIDLIRVRFRCNQACQFCFVSTHLPEVGEDAIRRAILDAAEAGRVITLTGGEPTLHPRLHELIALAARTSGHKVELQSNAVRLADATYLDSLVRAGLGRVLVALHASHAGLSDSITGAPGTWDKTVAGIDNLRRTRVEVSLNMVMCRANMHDLTAYVRFLGARWPGIRASLSFVAGSQDVVPNQPELIPRYSELVPLLQDALNEARRLGLELGSFAEMCGLPLCLLPPGMANLDQVSELPEGADGGAFMKPSACSGCLLSPKCYGIRTSYVELYGESELRPVVG